MKNLLLPTNHYSLSITKDIVEICEPLKRFGIDYFCFARCFRDNSVFALISDANLYQHHFKNEYPVSPNISQKIVKNNFFHLALQNENDDYSQAVYDYKNLFNVHHPLFFFECYDSYVDFFIYSYNKSNTSEAVNSYMNNFDALEGFKTYFKYQADTLIKNSNQHKIYIPEHMQFNFNEIILPAHQIKENNNFCDKISLTEKQRNCLFLTLKGKTAKEIARLTGVSFRTVQFHIEAIKIKFNCRDKKELIEKAANLTMIDSDIFLKAH